MKYRHRRGIGIGTEKDNSGKAGFGTMCEVLIKIIDAALLDFVATLCFSGCSPIKFQSKMTSRVM